MLWSGSGHPVDGVYIHTAQSKVPNGALREKRSRRIVEVNVIRRLNRTKDFRLVRA